MIIGTNYRSTEKLARNRQNRRYIGEISVENRKIGEKSESGGMRGEDGEGREKIGDFFKLPCF